MFIVWRKRAITTDRPVELFVDWFDQGGTRTRFSDLDREAWKSGRLSCRHTGPGRLTWTPCLMHSERIDGKPRQRLLHRFPAIRTCCLADQFLRAAWWHSIEEWTQSVHDIGKDDSLYFHRDKKAVFDKLREVVPRPTRKGVEAFTAYRLEKEAENRAHWESVHEGMRREARRQAEEQQRQEYERLHPGSKLVFWWEFLGVPVDANLDTVTKAYRKLAMQHHPDRNPGDPAAAGRFRQVQEAFDLAKQQLQPRGF